MKLFGFDVGSGNSVKDKLYWFITGFMSKMGFVLWGGGSPPAPAPTTSTSYTTNIPDYAQPYVENMLNAAQAQVYNPSGTGFNPYVPYSTDPTNYVAGFSPEQQQAFSTAANMAVPSQYGMATRGTLATLGGLGNAADQFGNIGTNYMNMATNPYATQAFMNPYVQASLAPQLALANQQYDIAGQQEQSKAAQQGAFGGSREALMGGLNRQNQMLAQNQLIGQGYNNAFNQAQQAQQFGANLGLQGQQQQLAALQSMLAGSNQLSGIGGAQLSAQQGIANQQAQFGQQQQQQQQNIINQAVQNYATAQQYPFMQLGLINSMLRGLPMQQSSTQMYQAPPNSLGTALGLGALAMGQANKKSGGVIKASAGIPMSHYSDQQLDQVKNSKASSLLDKLYAQDIQGVHAYDKANPQAAKILSQPLIPAQPAVMPPNPMQMAAAPQNRAGIGTIGTGDMAQMAGGGLLAFVGGGDTATDGTPMSESQLTPPAGYDPNAFNPQLKDIGSMVMKELNTPKGESENERKYREDLEKGIESRSKSKDSDMWTHLGLNLLAQKGPFLGQNLGQAGIETLNWMSTQEDLTDKDRKELMKFAIEKDRADETQHTKMMDTALNAQTAKENKAVSLASVQAQRDATIASQQATNSREASKIWGDAIARNAISIRSEYAKLGLDPDEGTVQRNAYKITYDAYKNTPLFKLLGEQPKPEEAPPAPPAPPPAPGLIDKLKDAFGGGNVIHFDAQGNRIQ